MGKIVEFPQKSEKSEEKEDEINAATIEALESLLEEAKSGVMVGMVYAYHTSADSVVCGRVGDCPPFATIGAIEVLKQDFMRYSGINDDDN